jgi:ATP-dependent Clp protease ATP-binding subunit ClpA
MGAEARKVTTAIRPRPLKRAIQEHILNALSMRLLEGEFKPGDRIKVSAKDGELVFQKK